MSASRVEIVWGSGHPQRHRPSCRPLKPSTISFPITGYENVWMNKEEQPKSRGLEPLLNINELAEYLGVPVSTIYDWRTNGKGPRAYRFGKRIMFGVTDIHAWMDTMREPSPGAASFPAPGETAGG